MNHNLLGNVLLSKQCLRALWSPEDFPPKVKKDHFVILFGLTVSPDHGFLPEVTLIKILQSNSFRHSAQVYFSDHFHELLWIAHFNIVEPLHSRSASLEKN